MRRRRRRSPEHVLRPRPRPPIPRPRPGPGRDELDSQAPPGAPVKLAPPKPRPSEPSSAISRRPRSPRRPPQFCMAGRIDRRILMGLPNRSRPWSDGSSLFSRSRRDSAACRSPGAIPPVLPGPGLPAGAASRADAGRRRDRHRAPYTMIGTSGTGDSASGTSTSSRPTCRRPTRRNASSATSAAAVGRLGFRGRLKPAGTGSSRAACGEAGVENGPASLPISRDMQFQVACMSLPSIMGRPPASSGGPCGPMGRRPHGTDCRRARARDLRECVPIERLTRPVGDSGGRFWQSIPQRYVVMFPRPCSDRHFPRESRRETPSARMLLRRRAAGGAP